jgi:nitrite reductase (NADH) large subunit
MRTPDVPDVYAIGEIALYNNFIYGLIAPGYTMANVAAQKLGSELGLVTTDQAVPDFTGADMSTKLKLLGCDVASFGVNQPRPDDPDVSYLTWNDPVSGIYRKLVLNKDGTKIRGGILVGDAGDYDRLHKMSVSGAAIEGSAASLLPPPSALEGLVGAGAEDASAVSDDPNAQICSCNDVTRGTIASAIKELGVDGATLPALKKCTKAGTGCGGCEPQVKQILKMELEKLGRSLSNHLCEHFSYSRQELMALVRTTPDVADVDSFEKIINKFGHGDGCEICKPAVGSMLASLVNGVILEDGREALQDTNDRSLANMQRGGSYSVVPRVPGGELSPEQLIALGETAQKYKLYTKITGGQRVDLFGAAKHELPDIWEELGRAGFESGHAYGKALRTVKSCVGSTWCRYGVQDSVSFAVEVENRYKGIRAPHKM